MVFEYVEYRPRRKAIGSPRTRPFEPGPGYVPYVDRLSKLPQHERCTGSKVMVVARTTALGSREVIPLSLIGIIAHAQAPEWISIRNDAWTLVAFPGRGHCQVLKSCLRLDNG